jgi:protein phosphatase 1L
MDILYGISTETGWRSSMEDERAIYLDDGREFFAAEIYDGHGGREAARIASRMLTPYFMHAWAKDLEKSLKERQNLYELLRQAYLAVDSHIVENNIQGGTTAANFFIIGDRFMAANAGDTRVVISTGEGCLSLTKDHKPELPEERKRIESLGGEVIFCGVARVQGVLSMSRALGDAHLKPYVTSEPRIVEGYLGKENHFVILACDGVWDVLKEEDVMKMVTSVADAEKVAVAVSTKALDYGSSDNITVIVLDLRSYVKQLKREKMEITKVFDYAV